MSTRTAIFGWLTWKPPIRGASQRSAKVCIVVIESTPSPWSEMSATAARRALIASPAARASRSPAGVSATSRGRRRNSGWSSRRSSAFTWKLTAAWVMPSSRAAPVKLSRRAAASKTRMALSGMEASGSAIRATYVSSRRTHL